MPSATNTTRHFTRRLGITVMYSPPPPSPSDLPVASLRAKQLQEWQEMWIGSSMHGFRPGHGADDAFMETALLIEKALLSQVPLLFDIRK